jgi:hypothetical protein
VMCQQHHSRQARCCSALSQLLGCSFTWSVSIYADHVLCCAVLCNADLLVAGGVDCEPRSTCGACGRPVPGGAAAPCSETAAAAAAAVVAKATAANGSTPAAGNALGLVSNGSGEY